jgi:trans-aconitate methyltransferase
MQELMSTANPIDLLFGGMEKLGPGSNVHTLHVLRLLPTQPFHVIVDAGCGTGRQTRVLAKELGTLVHAVDSSEPFLHDLTRRAKAAGIEPLIQTHGMYMQDMPCVFPHIDLLWSEGAAYNIGFANALTQWAAAINPGGFAVVSELSWLRDQVPEAAREFFCSGYPDMHSIQQNLVVAENADYRVLTTYTLPKEAWMTGYYDLLEPRAKAFMDHPDSSVRAFAGETVKEIEIFHSSEESYGYVFYALMHSNAPNTCPEGGCQGFLTVVEGACAKLWISDMPRRLSAWRSRDSSFFASAIEKIAERPSIGPCGESSLVLADHAAWTSRLCGVDAMAVVISLSICPSAPSYEAKTCNGAWPRS